MSSSLILCRLCLKASSNYKNLYYDNGLGTELYEMVHNYFHPKIVDLERAKHLTTLCLQCSRNICDFQNFQKSVIVAQLQIMANEVAVKTEGEEIQKPEWDSSNVGFTSVKTEDSIGQPEHDTNDYGFSITNEYSAGGEGTNEASADAIGTDHISQPKLELIDVPPEGEFNSDDEIPLMMNYLDHPGESQASADIRNHSVADNVGSSVLDFDYDVTTKRYRCKLCDNSYTQLSSLKRHTERQHSSSEDKLILDYDKAVKMFKCKMCGHAYKHKSTLVWHLTRQHCQTLKVDETNYECEECHEVFGTQKGLDRHHGICHGDAKEYRCKECDQIFGTFTLFRKHRWYNHRLQPKHKCSTCGKAFKNPSQLRIHLVSHTQRGTFLCPFCPMVFKHNSSLGKHKKRTHPHHVETGGNQASPDGVAVAPSYGDSVYPCRECGKTFADQLSYGRHGCQSTSPKHKCETCGKTFGTSSGLGLHVISHNTFPCDQCPMVFKRDSSRTQHRTTAHPPGK